jgi:hypothetical protein
MVAEEHDDASPDDAEPGHLVPEHPPEPSSSPALPLAILPTPRLVHSRTDGRMNEQRHGGCAAPLLRDLHLCCCRGVVNTEHLVGLYTGREKGLTSSCLGSSPPLQWLPRATGHLCISS